MLSICGEIILCDVSNCSEASVFLILCDVSIFFFLNLWNFFFLLEPLVVFFFNRSHGWVAFLSYFRLET